MERPADDFDDVDDEAPTRVTGAILGPYRLGEPLGSGGMANVYDAVHVSTGARAAVKVLHAKCKGMNEVVARFIREGRALQKMNHPNIVRVMDHGTSPDGGAWIAMEKLEGAPLDQLLKDGPLPEARALRIMNGVAKALATVHARGMVHRDVKPENVFVTNAGAHDEEAKLIDFGVAHVADEDLGDGSIKYTRVGSVLGSAAFMAPEQLDGRADVPTSATDTFAFGVTLYELLTGALPFEGTTMSAQIKARISEAIVPLAQRVPGARFSPALEDFIRRMLAYDVSRRPQSGLDLLQEIAVLQGRGPVISIAPPPPSLAATMLVSAPPDAPPARGLSVPPPSMGTPQALQPPANVGRAGAGAIGAVVGVLLTVVVVYVLHVLHVL